MGVMAEDCPFCKIVNGDVVDAREVYRDEHVVAFFPTQPVVLGHTLVVPRRHVPDIWSLDEGTAAHLTQAMLRVSNGIRRAFRPEGVNILQSNGEAATQSVFHVHVHILPRWSYDSVGDIWPAQSNYPEEAKDGAWRRLRLELQPVDDETGELAAMTTDITSISSDDRRKHLEFIQAVVARMSLASSAAKSWLLPVVTLTYGYALTRHVESVALLGVAASVLFSLLDVNYLRQEKAYRRLYETVARSPGKVPVFSLDPLAVDDPASSALTVRNKFVQRVSRWIPEPAVWMSWSIAPFYGGLVAVGVVIFMVVK